MSQDMDIEMLTETEISTIIDIEDYINDVTPIITSFNNNLIMNMNDKEIEQYIENHEQINTMLMNYSEELQKIINNYEGIEKYGKIVLDLLFLRSRINAIYDDNNRFIRHLNKELAQMGKKVSVEKEDSRGHDDDIQHIFMFVCHGSEYNPTGERNLYPFENNDYDSVGIFSTYGESAYVPMLNQKLMHTLNIHNVLDCDTMDVSTEYNKQFLTVNPLSMEFKFNDVNVPILGPYMGLFYLKVKEIEKNNIKVLEMKHLIRFVDTFPIAHTDINQIDHNPTSLQTVHQIELHNDQTINSVFIDNMSFGWDVVLNVINRFYKEFLNDSNGDPQIHMNEPVHIRLFCCREEKEKVIGKGKGRYGGISLRDKTLFNVEEVANVQPDNTNMRYFWMTNEQVVYFGMNIHNFNNFISNFLSQKPFYCEDRILIIYFLMLLDNDISNINLLLERLCTIFLDTEEKSFLSLLVMLSCNKTIYDMYKSKYIDITQYSSVSYALNGVFNEDLKNHIVSNIFSDCQKLAFGEGLKIYFMGTDKNNITLPYVLFIIFEHETTLVVSLNCINIEDQVEHKIYTHQHETHNYHPQQLGDGINVVLEKFNNIEIIYNNNIQGKGGMNKKGDNYKKTGKTLSQVLNEMNPDRPLRPRSKYGRSYEVKKKEHDSSQAIERMKEFDKRQPTGIFNFNPNPPISLKKPVEDQFDSQQTEQTDIDFTTPDSTPRTPGDPYTTPPRNTNYSTPSSATKTDTEGSPGDRDRERGQGIMYLPEESYSPPRGAYKKPKSGLPPLPSLQRYPNTLNSSPSFDDLQKAQKEMTRSVESLPGNKTDSDSEGNTQEEEMDFGGKKKGKRGKKTKRAKKVKKAKKARKTKKKRSNKK